jgi:chromosome segregation protein
MTRLKALELFGFKSFADRTRFEFPEGITVVVGPNGSGKSNVVDAIKWVLGEKSVRSLRGRDMTDVIFAGSVSRKPLNAAETSLFFDNSARDLPVEADEVQITRRVYRSGENEYLVNGAVSRLRDIRELFSGTGAATEAYSVIEQGRVDALLVASGRDRRGVFEEAAGITRFRARRAEALRRLERSEQHRQRLADIVGEVSSRLETVRHQAARARRYRQMSDRLRRLRIATAAEDLGHVDADVTRVTTALSALQEQFVAAEATATGAAGNCLELDRAEQEITPHLAAAQAAFTLESQRAAAAEATFGLLLQRRSEFEAERSRLLQTTLTSRRRRQSAVAALGQARGLAESINAELARIDSELAVHSRSAAGTQQHVVELRARLATLNLELESLDGQRQSAEAAERLASRRLDAARTAADGCRLRIDAAKRQHASLLESSAAAEGNLDALSRRVLAANAELDSLEAFHRERAAALETAWRDLADWQSKLEVCRERKRLLEELAGRQEGLSDAARGLVSPTTGETSPIPGLRGVLGNLIEAPVEWAGLVDIALGHFGQSLVVDSLDELLRWFTGWCDSAEARNLLAGGGRVTFTAAEVPSETAPVDGSFEADGYPGVVGRLDRLVAADRLQPCSRLLERVWVVERIDQGQALVQQAPPGTIVMTRAGHCLSGRTAFEIGSATVTGGLVARQSELRSLTVRNAELVRAVEQATALIADLQSELAELGQQIRRAQGRRQQESETAAASRAELDRLRRECTASQTAIAEAGEAALDADRQAASCSEMMAAATEELSARAAAAAQARRTLGEMNSALDASDRDRGEVIDSINRLRIDRAAAEERRLQGSEAVARQLAALDACDTELALARGQEQSCDQRLETIDFELLAAGSVFAEATIRAETHGRELDSLNAGRIQIAAERAAAVGLAEQARERLTRLAEAIHTHQLDVGEARHRRSRIVERIRDEYDLDIEALEETTVSEEEPLPADRASCEAEIETLRRKLGSMTSVNLEALAESEALAERLAGLEAQLADVSDAKRSIEQLIARIDDESRRLLGETIETVRGHFRELFERVFGGGQADIVLDPEMDLLETSVEIVARPPGKEPRSISLLSGGEKTMTCVALLLAIFRSRPSPFCVLDEVDAALDEANVDRFVGVLRDFLSSTQFIIVTHSKKTMAAATTLYGVTMEESGVSKRVSVRFEATAAAARPASKAA